MRSESANVAPYIEGIRKLDQQLASPTEAVAQDRFLFEGHQALMTIRANATTDHNYMVYERCSGVTLKEWLPYLRLGDDASDALRLALALRIVRSLLAAVYALSEGGGLQMAHRDIKPPNIQVQSPFDTIEDDPNPFATLVQPGTVKLLDPGLLLNMT